MVASSKSKPKNNNEQSTELFSACGTTRLHWGPTRRYPSPSIFTLESFPITNAFRLFSLPRVLASVCSVVFEPAQFYSKLFIYLFGVTDIRIRKRNSYFSIITMLINYFKKNTIYRHSFFFC